MRINNVQTVPSFGGNVYTFRLPAKDLCKVERNSWKIIEYAKDKNFDFVLFKNGEQNGMSVLAKNIAQAKRSVYNVLGYPSESESKDINLILKTMHKATEELSESNIDLGWSCE